MKPVLAAFLLLLLAACASVPPRDRAELVGHWRYQDEVQSCDYRFEANGSFTGEVRQRRRVVLKFSGRWALKGNLLLYTYISEVFGRIPAGTKDQDQLLEVRPDSFLIQAANGDRRRYRRVP